MGKKRTIIIAGAGVAGLTAALLIANSGFRIIVLEKSSDVDKAGVGIQLSPNATHILAGLGLLRQLAAASVAPKEIIIKKGASGRVLSRFPLGDAFTDRYGAPYLVLHRADLASLLLNACNNHPDIDVIFNSSVEDVAMHANGVTVMALDAKASGNPDGIGQMVEYMGIALVGADGGHSTVRTQIIGGSDAVPSGDVAWRSLVPVEKIPKSISKLNTTLWMGKRGHVVCYPIRRAQHINIVAITPASCATHSFNKRFEADSDALMSFFASWDPDLKNLLELTAKWQGWPLNQVDPSGKWSRESTVLIGDAAHAMLPYAAQGGAAAIEDAAMLANSIEADTDNISKAFANYENLRKPRAKKIWQLARKNREIYHLGGLSAAVRNIVLNNTSTEKLYKRFDWLYGWKM